MTAAEPETVEDPNTGNNRWNCYPLDQETSRLVWWKRQGTTEASWTETLLPQPTTDVIENRKLSLAMLKKWTIRNKLQLNEVKTEALLFDPSKSSDLPDVPGIGQSYVPFVSILPVF